MAHKHLTFKFGISIPIGTKIGYGFYIGHFGNIVVNGKATIGNNCNLSQGVTIGEIPFGNSAGVPVLGDNIYLAPGSTVIGDTNVGSFSIVAPNSVLNHSIEDHSVVSGIPAKLISANGSRNYIQNPFRG
jgi:serine O-acetyltransferase